MASDQLILSGLLVVDGVLYSLLLFSVLRRRRNQVIISNLVDAFRALETAIKENSDLPSGFTWREALRRLRVRQGLDLGEMETALNSYEAYRYGGLPLSESDYKEVLKAANLMGGVGAGHRR